MQIPDVVRAKAVRAGAQAWVAGLAALVAALERDWSITVGRGYPNPTEAYVAEAVTADGTPAVLKLMIPRPGDHAAREIAVLRLAHGEGCVALLRDDVTRGALLLERLGPAMSDLDLPQPRRLELLCDLAQAVWRPAPQLCLPTGAEQAAGLAQSIVRDWDALGRPCSAATIEHALGCAARRGRSRRGPVLVHGDVHQWNALRAGDGFRLVDPDGLLAEPEYDLGVLMREDPVELMQGDPGERARFLARRTGTDATAVWEWGVVERVSTGLLATAVGLQPAGAQMLAAADAISASAASAG